jgi:hypothetical protein
VSWFRWFPVRAGEIGDNLDAVDLGEGEFRQPVKHAELAIARWNVV